MDREINDNKSVFRNLKELFKKPLFILILITSVLVTYLLNIQIKIGVPYYDVFNYLNNAFHFAGMGSNGVVNHLPPLLPVLTSIFFRMGYVSIDVIFIMSGLIFIIGVIGLYHLLKQRFDPIQSLAGSLIFISLPVVMSWAVSGGIDLPGVVFSIWSLYFLIVGLNKDSKFLYFVLPFLIIAILARYTAGLIIIPMIFYLLINIKHLKKIQNIRNVILGISIEFGVLLAIFIYFIMQLDISALSGLFFDVVTSSASGVGDSGYNPNNLYFIQNLLNYISVGHLQGTYQQILNPSEGIPSILSYIIALLTFSGLSFYIYRGLSSKIEKTDKSIISITNIGKIGVILILFIALMFSIYNKSLIISEILLLTIIYLLYVFLNNKEYENSNKRLGLDLMFLTWFGAFLIFHTILPFKVDRYFITMAPALAYFIILGLSQFIKEIGPKIKYLNSKTWLVYIIIGLVCLTSATATYIGHTPQKTYTVDIHNSTEWIKIYDSNYNNEIIGSDYPNAVTWYLHKDTTGAYLKFYNNTNEFEDYLQKNGVYYYLDSNKPHPDLKGYRIIKIFGVVAIYKRTSP